uniref:Uncharacterized protein n=1 Tax=Hemiselmis andersenii TaxID=464988 RepID=A0A7S1H291_HEMAN|mmetsp:Transcript_33534/g.81725  ORF Transcript_33534/g.81725 Transcript_33534/m.81725 type:complete len:166 (+) Transcript_33534:268-765(+)
MGSALKGSGLMRVPPPPGFPPCIDAVSLLSLTHRNNNSRFFKDVRLVPSEASRAKAGAAASAPERRAQPSVPKESQAEGFFRMERKKSSVKAPLVPASGPFRIGGRVGGSGAPGFRATRNGGRPGDGMWNPLVDEQINCAREVRERLHVKNGMGYTPAPVLPFHE